MKRTLLVFLMLMGCLFFAQVDIKDVSPVLDIYVPVSFVIENKIMELDENGNFRGGLLTTRFDIAQYIYRTIKTFQLDELTKRLSTISDAQKETFAKTAGLEAAYKTYDQRLREIENATVNLQSQIDKLSQELFSQLQKQFLDYVKAQENQLGKIDALTSRVDALEKLSSELFKQAQSQQSELEAISKEQTNIKNQLAGLSQQLSTMKISLDTLNKKFDQLSSDLASFKDSTKNEFNAFSILIDQKISASEGKMNFTLKSMQNELALQKKELMDRAEEMNKLKQQLQEVQARLATLEGFASKQQVQELRSQLNELTQKASKIEEDLKNLENKLVSFDISRLQKRIEELEVKNKTLESNLNMAYIIGGVGIAVGLLALIFAMGR